MMHRTEWLIYGAGLSALVLAERLGNAGKQVLLINPADKWGGIFGGIEIDGERFDAGMTNFEFELFGSPEDNLQGYHPDRKSDVGRYVHYVQQYLSRFVQATPLPTPCMRFDKHFMDDLIISNCFNVLQTLEPNMRQAMLTELQGIVAAPNPLHPKTKNDPDSILASTVFETVSLANHGPTFHHLFIEPMFRKVLGIATGQIESIFHRNGWAPLFYPETLLSQFGPSPQPLRPTVFRYPKGEHFGAFIGRISAAIKEMDNVRVIYAAKDVEINVADCTLRMSDQSFAFKRLAWGAELDTLQGFTSPVLQPTQRASLDLFFIKVRQEGVGHRFAVLIDPEADSPFYRVTNQNICADIISPEHKIILECNSAYLDEAGTNSAELLQLALERYGIDPKALVTCHRRNFKGALAIPTHGQMLKFNQQRDRLAIAYPALELIGASSGYISVTLNDHIIQALKIAQQEGALT